MSVNHSSDRKGAERLAQATSVGADMFKAPDVARIFDKVDSAAYSKPRPQSLMRLRNTPISAAWRYTRTHSNQPIA